MSANATQNIRFRGLSVLLVSMSGIAFEVMLTRYFAIASFSEFGYWVISMAMVGYALSGVLLSIFSTSFVKMHRALLFVLPVLLMLVAIAGFHLTTINPFNPLALENPVLWQTQLVNIGLYYLALFPFFFLVGSFLGLNFMTFRGQVMGLYGADLIGAGIGAILILVLMFAVHPFYLVCAIPPVLFLAALVNLPYAVVKRRKTAAIVALVVLALCETWVIKENRARFYEYKAVYTVLNVENNRIVREYRSPKGYSLVLDNFTERRDLPVTNNLGLLHTEGPPESLGLYRDGNRVTSLPKPGIEPDLSYVNGALCTLPYVLREKPRALLVGSGGGFRISEVGAAQCSKLVVLESDEVVYSNLASAAGNGTEVHYEGPQSYLSRDPEPFDVVDIAVEHLDGGKANIYAFTRECIQRYYRALTPRGLVSIPITIRQFPGYAEKAVNTVVDALRREGVANPQDHIIVYRSEWIARVLVCKSAFTPEDIAQVRSFCGDRSFDTPYFPGIKPEEVEVWNESPPFTLEDEQADAAPGASKDSLMTDLVALLSDNQKGDDASATFDLSAFSNERPFLYSIVQLGNLRKVLHKLDQIPQTEIGLLVNYCVLAQAALFGLVVCLLPLIRVGRVKAGSLTIVRGIVYFAGLGLGFLFVEMTLMVLTDAVSSFAIVRSGMLIFSGLGSLWASRRFERTPRTGVLVTLAVVAATVAAYWLILDRATLWIGGWPFVGQCAAILVFVAPVSFAMGVPFSMGLRNLEGDMAAFLPMAWGINGAFSVIAPPLATVLAFRYGYHIVMMCALAVYLLTWMTFPKRTS
jgi:hypothetical protein